MAIVVEDGTGLPDAETYVSVADCVAYLDARSKFDFGLLTEQAQEAALRNAADYLDARYGSRLQGYRLLVTQALYWPRTDVEFDNVCWEPAPLPTSLVRACCEAAALAGTGTDLFLPLDRGGQVTEKLEIVGPITERTKWSSSAPVGTSYPAIDRLMRPLCASDTVIGTVVRG
jgi:hypothetical protein